MVDYLPRSAWGARASRGGTSLVASRVDGIAVHWPGTNSTTPIGKDRVDDALRGWQDYHMDVRGWSDIAYQVAVDQWGRAWILRGLTVQPGANGNEDLNERYGALLLVLVKGEQPTEAMLATARGVIADFRGHYPDGRLIVGHGEIRPDGTDCPGAATRAAIAAGKFNPSTPPKEWDDMFDSIDQFKQTVRSAMDPVIHPMGQRIEELESQERVRDAEAIATARKSAVRVEALFVHVLRGQGVAQEDIDAILAAVSEPEQPPAEEEPPA